MKKLILLLIFILIHSNAFATYYWIDDTGTETVYTSCDTADATPPSGSTSGYCSPTTGLASVNANVAAGDTVYFRGGTYNITSDTEVIKPANSGTSISNRITYASYSKELVNFMVTGAESAGYIGIAIYGKSWIKVTGYYDSPSDRNMKFSNFSRFLYMVDSTGSRDEPFSGTYPSYNEISYLEFANSNNKWITSGDLGGGASQINCNATYNWVHHNTWYNMGGYTSTQDIGSVLDLGWEDCGLYTDGVCTDNTHDNVIEDNHFYHGGHQVLGLFHYNNVVRNNIFNNDRWFLGSDTYRHGYRVIQTQSQYNTDYHHKYNLIEGNRI